MGVSEYEKKNIDLFGDIMEECKKKVFEIFKKDYPSTVNRDALIACINSLFIQTCKERYFMLHRRDKNE